MAWINVSFIFGYVLTISSLLLRVRTQNEPDILRYSVTEESGAGQIVGNVFNDARLGDDPEIEAKGYLTFADTSASVVSLFTISTGKVLTTGPRLDRDVLCPGAPSCVVDIDLQLQPMSKFRIIKVQVTVLDINDNAPQFTDSVISRSVSEASAIGSKIPLPNADDPDSPSFGIDHYSINDTKGLFALDKSTTPSRFLILQARLDREAQDNFQIELTATDRGQPPRSGSTVLNINIVDVNDNVPQFDNDTYYTIINEDFPVQLPVITVHASDKDLGKNAEITYDFDSATQDKYGEFFSIDKTTGTIRVRNPLDYETLPLAALTVTATNTDDSSMSSFTTVHINIGDINDNSPAIRVHGLTTGSIIYKEETSAINDFVAHVAVTDPDSGKNGKFDCNLSGIEFSLTKMYETNFVIQNNIALDRELTQKYNVRMVCSDEGTPRKSSVLDLTISITDINDNSPTFNENNYYATVTENNYVGFPITTVRAIDPDSGLNGTVKYHFENEVSSLLYIDPATGNISASARFDRETLPRLEAIVVAADLGTPKALSATATVIIDILDEDDNSPVFAQSEYTFTVLEGQAIQTYIGQVKAADTDSDLYNQFGYFVTYDGGDAESFTIDRRTGKIYTSKMLNREQQKVYRFGVRAVSDGENLRTNSALVVVRVNDINDAAPAITYPSPTNNSVYLSNRIHVGTTIARVLAYDPDEGANSELSYAIVSGDSDGHFSLGPGGEVVVERSLEGWDQRAFGLVIMVADSGSPPRSTETYLNVVVNRSLSDHAPGLISHSNLTIVIAIATVSGLIMVALVVAIVMLLRWPRMRSAAAKRYNYVARAHHVKAGIDNPTCDAEKQICDDVHHTQQRALTTDSSQLAGYGHHTAPTDNQGGYGRPGGGDMPHKGRDSESSSSSAADTDSGRGSHEDVVLDQSASRIQIDKDPSDHRTFDLPLLSALHGGHVTPPLVPHRTWRVSQRSSQGHPPGVYSHDVTRPHHSNTDSHHGYAWHSGHVSGEMHV